MILESRNQRNFRRPELEVINKEAQKRMTGQNDMKSAFSRMTTNASQKNLSFREKISVTANTRENTVCMITKHMYFCGDLGVGG